AVARYNKGPFDLVPNGGGEHAIQPGKDAGSPFLEPVDDDVRVAVVGSELVTPPDEFRPQIPIAVNLAVVHEGVAAVFIEHRLMTTRDADDAQACHAHRRALFGALEDPFGVRTTVLQAQVHPGDQGRLVQRAKPETADDAAHQVWPPATASKGPSCLGRA